MPAKKKDASNAPYVLDKVGSDVEVFLLDQAGKPTPVCGLVGGTKHHPKPIPELGAGYAIQEDNVMVEYNIPASSSESDFVGHIHRMNNYLDSLFAPMGLKKSVVGSMHFDPAQLQTKQSQEVGCEPDFCVWTRSINPRPSENPAMATLRTSGGHIHVSYTYKGNAPDPKNVFEREPLVKALDITLGLPSLFLDPDKERKLLYGKSGAFRSKPYGLEYRVLSNFWTKDEVLTKWAFEGVRRAFILANHYSRNIDNEAGNIQAAVSSGSRSDEYLRYLMTTFNLIDMVPNCVPYDGLEPSVTYA